MISLCIGTSLALALVVAPPTPVAPTDEPDATQPAAPGPIEPPAGEPAEDEEPVAVAPAPESPPAHPPDPRARPSEGVYAVGSSGVAPLPPAPPPVDPSTIRRDGWRGVGWLALRVLASGPVYGDAPGRPTVIALGGGAEGGWRIRQWIGLGMGFSRQPHELYRQDVPDAPAVFNRRGYMTAWDAAFVRLYAPVRGRIDPFIDVGGGLALFDPARQRRSIAGGTVRASFGFDAWITRQLTLGVAGIYRVNFVDETVGHAWQAAIDLGVHW
jgi:hypothetical protein